MASRKRQRPESAPAATMTSCPPLTLRLATVLLLSPLHLLLFREAPPALSLPKWPLPVAAGSATR